MAENSFVFTEKLVKEAYLRLKQTVYYENLDYFLRQRLAQFETTGDIDKKLHEIYKFLRNPKKYKVFFEKLLKKIEFKLLPKSVQCVGINEDKPTKDGNFISNVRSSESYSLNGVNYFIDAPIEIHIVDTLWVMIVGGQLEKEISNDAYGNRIKVKNIEAKQSPSGIFKFYIKQYNLWRDQAIEKATNSIEKDKENVAIFSIDLKQYYYHIDLNFNEIYDLLENNLDSKIHIYSKRLTQFLKKIHEEYVSLLRNHLKISHPELKISSLLPIGLASSHVLGNWYLRNFDKKIRKSVNLTYYGRYVDDILMVFNNPKIATSTSKENIIKEFVKNHLNKVMEPEQEKIIIKNSALLKNNFKSASQLFVQNDKVILQFFDKNHSKAGLRLFKKELERNSSAFRFLPSNEIDRELDEFAYDLLYDGSINKLRSVIGLAENSMELSKYLSQQIILHQLCEKRPNDESFKQLMSFFNGKNLLDFYRLWEKVFSLALVVGRFNDACTFYNLANNLIEKLTENKIDSQESDKDINNFLGYVREDLQEYLKISIAIPCGLLSQKNKKTGHKRLDMILEKNAIWKLAGQMRKSNLIKHNLVSYPIINYTNYDGNLTDSNLYSKTLNNNINDIAIEFSPRFIHLEEIQLYQFFYDLNHNDFENDNWFEEVKKKYSHWNKLGTDNSSLPSYKNMNNKNTSLQYKALSISNDFEHKSDKKSAKKPDKKIKIAIGNIEIKEQDIKVAYNKRKGPNLSLDRQKKLYELLNASEREDVELLVLPEVSVPCAWLPFMSVYARRHQLGIVFGLEHWVHKDIAYNFIVTILPFVNNSIYNSCFISIRTKNHYAPQEIVDLKRAHLKPKKHKVPYYELVNWKGIQFAAYNCFELADISHRGLFRSKLDLLIACVWNKDTNYYKHIMSSAIRDLHCYAIQANTSQYGGSCILQPTKSVIQDIVTVKGGENSCILTATLDIEKLRSFQELGYSEVDDSFKPTPPGFDYEDVADRER